MNKLFNVSFVFSLSPLQANNSNQTQAEQMPEIINSLALNKRISSSSTVKSFISFLESSKDKEQDIKMFILIDAYDEEKSFNGKLDFGLEKNSFNYINSSKLLSFVYWKIIKDPEVEVGIADNVSDNYVADNYISLTGNIICIKNNTDNNETEFSLIGSILDTNSSDNLLSLFIDPNNKIVETDTSKIDPIFNPTARSLLDSLARQAQIHLDTFTPERSQQTQDLEIYFQSSVVIGNKQEYPVYIVTRNRPCNDMVFDNVDLDNEFIQILTDSAVNYETKSDTINSFYSSNYRINPEILESKIFSNSQIYEALFEESTDLQELKVMVESLRSNGLKLSDLLEDPVERNDKQKIENLEIDTDEINFEMDLKHLNESFNEIFKARTPNSKLSHLLTFHSNLTSQFTANNSINVNTDTLLPLLTFVLVQLERGYEILPEIRFVERYAHESSLSGVRGYVLTNMNAAIEVIKSIYHAQLNGLSNGQSEKDKDIPTEDQSQSPEASETPIITSNTNSGHFANIISSIASIGQVPRAIASSISSTLRSRPSPTLTLTVSAPIISTVESSVNDNLAAFRERILATNSANDLMIRDINPLLEDYKNLLFIVLKL